MSIVGPDDYIDKETKKEEYRDIDEDQAAVDHLAPSRWWFSSTLFPLIAGTFGPIASTFNLCALIIDWRVILDPSSTTSTEAVGLFIPDPAWLLAVNAVSLVIAVIANIALLAKNVGRIPFNVAAVTTILGWYISSLLLIGLVAAAPAHLPLPRGEARTFSQAYYYAILAAALYFIIASLLLCTAVGVYLGKYASDVKLNFSQSTLMFQVVLFLVYVLAAAAVYARIEDWNFLDGVYFLIITLFTIGYGDFTPKTHLGRGLFFPMAIGGILFVGLIVASISTMVLDPVSAKVSIRTMERVRQKAVKTFDSKSGNVQVHPFRKDNLPSSGSSELDRREREFNAMRKVQQTASTYNRTIALSVSLGMVIVLWFIGAVCFWQAELAGQQWSYFESLYFTYVSLLTVGYGDFYPQDNSAKPVFVLWALIALPTLTVLIGSAGGIINEFVNSVTLWLGDHLPERAGALGAVKNEAAKAKGDAFKEAKPPGFMEDGQPNDADTEDSQHAEAVQGIVSGMSENQGGNPRQDAAGKHYRHYLLMKEMRNVVEHIGATPPRKYSFEEWTWFLKLTDEDESDPRSHQRPKDVHHVEAAGTQAQEENVEGPEREACEGNHKWSWLGRKSPLMTAQDEPKWVLERLMDALERELREKGRQGMEAR